MRPRQPGGQLGTVVTEAIRRAVAGIIDNDPLVRSQAAAAIAGDADSGLPGPGDDSAVHDMRVACRRLRSDLRTFSVLVAESWSVPLREELRWLAGLLGAARDAEVLRLRLARVEDRLAPLDAAALGAFDRLLAGQQREALTELNGQLDSERYRALRERLTDAARSPELTEAVLVPAAVILPGLAGGTWRRLVSGGHGVPGAGDLDADAPDHDWHGVRVNAKRARYAVESIGDILGDRPVRLARRLAEVQQLLGAHQDAAVAAAVWRQFGTTPNHAATTLYESTLTAGFVASSRTELSRSWVAGRLFERERREILRLRAEWPAVWARCTRSNLVGWLA